MTISTYKGKKLLDMTKEELIKVINYMEEYYKGRIESFRKERKFILNFKKKIGKKE